MGIHEQIEALRLTLMQEIIVHALADAGHLTELRCQWESCPMPDAAFVVGDRRHRAAPQLRLVAQPRRLYNLRLVHAACNKTGRRGAARPSEQKLTAATERPVVHERPLRPGDLVRVIDHPPIPPRMAGLNGVVVARESAQRVMVQLDGRTEWVPENLLAARAR